MAELYVAGYAAGYRKYRPASLRDLLRVIRNKHNHFRELPPALAAKLGPLPGGFFRCCSHAADCAHMLSCWGRCLKASSCAAFMQLIFALLTCC